jgi:hypothetical protein
MATPKITTGYTQPGTKLIVKPDIAKYTDKNGKVSAKYQTDLTNFYAKSTDPEAVKYRTDELTKKYGSLKDADGKTIFTPTYIKALAEGIEPPASLDKAVTDWATAKMKEATNYDWNNFSGGIGSVAAQNLLRSFVKDPSQVDTALTFKSSGADVTPEQKQANAANLEAKVAKAEKDTATLENYDPNAGAWNPSKNTQATPYGDVLSGLISGYKNPYASDYVNPLAAVEKPNLTNIQTLFNKNAIPQDLVSLFNSAGTNYAGGTRANPLVRPTLPNNGLVKLTQPSATESAEQLAKPGAPDTTNTTLPVVTDKPPVVTDKPPVVTDKPPVVTDKPPVVTDKPPVVTDKPPVVTDKPPVVTDKPPVVTDKPPVFTSEQGTSFLEGAATNMGYQGDLTDIAAMQSYITPVVTDKPPVVTDKPPVFTSEQGTSFLEGAATNMGYQGDLTDTAAMQSYITPANQAARLAAEKAAAEKKVLADKAAAEQAGLVALANQQAADKAAKEKASVVPSVSADSNFTSINPNTYGPQQVTLDPNTVALSNSPSVIAANRATAANQATVVPYSTSVVPSVSAGNNFTGMSNNIGPQQVTLNPNTVVDSPSGINALSAQTVALPPSGPQPINPSNGGPSSATVGPITAAQRDLGPLNISNLGAVIGPQAMNSNAGGVASLVGPQVTVQPQTQPAVTQQPAPILTTGIVNGVGTNPALRAKVLAAQAAQASNMKV